MAPLVFLADPELQSLEPLAEYDCCILEFDVIPTCNTLLIRFVFGSEEYPEYVNSSFNDAFGFFVTGTNPSGANYNNTNVATLPDNTTIVSVDNVSPILILLFISIMKIVQILHLMELRQF